MQQEDDAEPDVGREHEPAEVVDVVHVRRRDHPRHERQHAVGREAQHHAHEPQDELLQRVDALLNALAHFGLVTLERQRREAEHRREHHDAHDRRRARAGQVREDVRGHHRGEQRRQIQLGRVGHARFHVGAAFEFTRPLHEAFGAQAEEIRHADADGGRKRRGQQQRAEHPGADLPERLGVVQLRHRRQNRHQHERCHHHLQQPDVDAADDPHPGHRARDGGAAEPVGRLGERAEHHAEEHGEEHVARNRGPALATLVEVAQREYEDGHVGENG